MAKIRRQIRLKSLQGFASKILSELLLINTSQYESETEEFIQKAIEINILNGTRFWLGQSYHTYFEFFKLQEKLPKATEEMTKAIDLMKECGADGWIERYEKELASLAKVRLKTDAEMKTQWTDPEFEAGQRAFYYGGIVLLISKIQFLII